MGTSSLGWIIVYIEIKGSDRFNFLSKVEILSLKIVLVLVNRVKPDKVPRYATFEP